MITEEYKNELMQKFIGSKSHKMWAMGYQLDTITKELNEKIPNEVVKIIIPYADFNCSGKVSDINHDVVGIMPSTYLYGDRSKCIEQDDTTTLFYGVRPITNRNFVPFLAECDCFRIDKIEGNTIYLEKDLSWRAFI